MKRKFGEYIIEVTNIFRRNNKDKYTIDLSLIGNPEIGLDIPYDTWKINTVMQYIFKDNYKDYEVITITNRVRDNRNDLTIYAKRK